MSPRIHSTKSSRRASSPATPFFDHRRRIPQGESPLAEGRGFDASAGFARARVKQSPRSGRDPRTGLPRHLKRAAEVRSGISMDDVRVAYNAMLPGTVGARAVAMGSRIAIAPGAESSVAHELWHVVQQKLGLVHADGDRDGRAINADPILEREADAFGDDVWGGTSPAPVADTGQLRMVSAPTLAPMQLDDSDDEFDESDDYTSAKKRKGATTKKRKVESDSDSGESSSSDAEPESGWDEGLLGYHGAKQQGKISVAQGKQYVGPMPMVGHRAEQVTRHMTNLALNRATKEQRGKGKKAVKPVEVQMSAVGKRLLINSNNRESSETLASGIRKAQSLYDYVADREALEPALDKDRERPKRYQSKLAKAASKKRDWQRNRVASPEDSTDIGKAENILSASQSKGVGVFDPSDPHALKVELDKWDKGTAPRTYVVLHDRKGNRDEHAERVQTRFRVNQLKRFEDLLSTAPTGPKTTCLGCASYHQANFPEHLHPSEYSGAYFGKGSPATTKEEIEAAKSLVKSRPATGSVSQNAYQRNSDDRDSDSDDEGRPVFPRPRGYRVPIRGGNPEKLTWDLSSSETREFPSNLKRQAVLKRLEREKSKKKPSPPKKKQR